jgi:hypothetical protein
VRRTIDLDATRNSLIRLPGMAIPLRLDRRPTPGRFVRGIYLSTPLFVAFDYVYGVSLRIPFLDALPAAKPFYYAAVFGCGIMTILRPRWTAAIGLGESVANISLLILSTGAAYLGMLESAASPDVVIVNPFTPQAVASLVLSATVMGASYVVRLRPAAHGGSKFQVPSS